MYSFTVTYIEECIQITIGVVAHDILSAKSESFISNIDITIGLHSKKAHRRDDRNAPGYSSDSRHNSLSY